MKTKILLLGTPQEAIGGDMKVSSSSSRSRRSQNEADEAFFLAIFLYPGYKFELCLVLSKVFFRPKITI